MACITLTRQQVSPYLGDRDVPGWRVEWEGRLVADWCELSDGRLLLSRRTTLNGVLCDAAGLRREPQEFDDLDALREWYLRSAEACEGKRAASR